MKKIIFLLFISVVTYGQRFNSRPIIYDTDYQTLLNAMTTNGDALPSIPAQVAQNNFVIDLKNYGIWSQFDVLENTYTDGANNTTRYNWKTATRIAIQNGFPVFTYNGGVANDGIATYWDTGFAPSSGTNYTQNSCEAIIFYKNLGSTFNTGKPDGVRSVSSGVSQNVSVINPMYSSLVMQGNSNAGAGTAASSNAQFTTNDGMYFYGRTNSSTEFVKKESGARVTLSSQNSSGRSVLNFVIGGLNDAGSIGGYVARSFLLKAFGGLLSTTDEANFLTAWSTYKTAIDRIAPLATIGIFYNKGYWPNLNDFTTNGTTPTVATNGEIAFSGGAGTFTKTIDLTNYVMNSKNWTINVKVRLGTVNGSSFGWGIGVRSVNTQVDQSICARFVGTSGSGYIQNYTGAASGMSGTSSSTSLASFTTGDVISLTFTMNTLGSGNNYVATAKNITTNSATVTTTGVANYIPNAGRFSLFNIGGAWNLLSYTITINDFYKPFVLAVGDSKTIATKGTYFGNGWVTQVSDVYSNSTKTMSICAGGNDRSTEYVLLQGYINNVVKPQYVLVQGISNDIRGSVPSGTWQANISGFITSVTGAGAKVILSSGMYETSINQTAFQTWVNANYPVTNVTVLDYVTTVIGLDADGVHPNNAGYLTYASTLLSSGKLP